MTVITRLNTAQGLLQSTFCTQAIAICLAGRSGLYFAGRDRITIVTGVAHALAVRLVPISAPQSVTVCPAIFILVSTGRQAVAERSAFGPGPRTLEALFEFGTTLRSQTVRTGRRTLSAFIGAAGPNAGPLRLFVDEPANTLGPTKIGTRPLQGIGSPATRTLFE
jgi:hypothetical protein